MIHLVKSFVYALHSVFGCCWFCNDVTERVGLGPTMADFYMAHLENSLLNDNSKKSNPKFYRRYVDDIIAVFKNKTNI